MNQAVKATELKNSHASEAGRDSQISEVHLMAEHRYLDSLRIWILQPNQTTLAKEQKKQEVFNSFQLGITDRTRAGWGTLTFGEIFLCRQAVLAHSPPKAFNFVRGLELPNHFPQIPNRFERGFWFVSRGFHLLSESQVVAWFDRKMPLEVKCQISLSFLERNRRDSIQFFRKEKGFQNLFPLPTICIIGIRHSVNRTV